MAVPTVQLTGTALTGIHTDGPRYAAAIAALPTTVKLGRRPPDPAAKQRALHLADFLDVNRRAQTLPSSTNWREKAALAIARMYLNDQEGDCVWASNIHLLGVTSANDSDSGGIVQATDNEVHSQYQQVCGPGDNGCVITRTLDWGITNGWKAGGKTYKLAGYASVDWTTWDLLRACCQDFGGFKIGINLPDAWTGSAIWDVTNTRIVGGHDVYVIDFDSSYLYLSSWGRIYKMTKAAALSTRWLEEAYVVLSPTWTGPDQTSPSGYDVAGLVAAMEAIKGGNVPVDPTPPPVPPAPPVPPVPPTPPPVVTPPDYAGTMQFHLPIFGTVTGTVNLKPVMKGQQDSQGVQWMKAFFDTIVLFRAISAKNWSAARESLLAVLADLGINLAAGLHATNAAAPTVDIWVILEDVSALLHAIAGRNFVAALMAVKALLTDFGIDLPF